MEAKLSIRELRIDHWQAERQAGRQAGGRGVEEEKKEEDGEVAVALITD